MYCQHLDQLILPSIKMYIEHDVYWNVATHIKYLQYAWCVHKSTIIQTKKIK